MSAVRKCLVLLMTACIAIAGFAGQAAAAPAQPTLNVSLETSSPVVGKPVTLKVTLEGANNPEGGLRIEAFKSPSCGGEAQGSAEAPVAGTTSKDLAVTPPAAGSYWVIAKFTSDDTSENKHAESPCAWKFDAAKRKPQLKTTTERPTIALGESTKVTTELSEAFNVADGDEITFKFAAPESDCSQVISHSEKITDNKASTTFSPTRGGRWKVVAEYAGDENNEQAKDSCDKLPAVIEVVSPLPVQPPGGTPAPTADPPPLKFSLQAVTLKRNRPLSALPKKGRLRIVLRATNSRDEDVEQEVVLKLKGLKPAEKGVRMDQDAVKIKLTVPKKGPRGGGKSSRSLIVEPTGADASVEVEREAQDTADPASLRLSRETGRLVVRLRDNTLKVTKRKRDRTVVLEGTVSRAVCSGNIVQVRVRLLGGRDYATSKAGARLKPPRSAGPCAFRWTRVLPAAGVRSARGLVYQVKAPGAKRWSKGLRVLFER